MRFVIFAHFVELRKRDFLLLAWVSPWGEQETEIKDFVEQDFSMFLASVHAEDGIA